MYFDECNGVVSTESRERCKLLDNLLEQSSATTHVFADHLFVASGSFRDQGNNVNENSTYCNGLKVSRFQKFDKQDLQDQFELTHLLL